jgi:hypothetical protein
MNQQLMPPLLPEKPKRSLFGKLAIGCGVIIAGSFALSLLGGVLVAITPDDPAAATSNSSRVESTTPTTIARPRSTTTTLPKHSTVDYDVVNFIHGLVDTGYFSELDPWAPGLSAEADQHAESAYEQARLMVQAADEAVAASDGSCWVVDGVAVQVGSGTGYTGMKLAAFFGTAAGAFSPDGPYMSLVKACYG